MNKDDGSRSSIVIRIAGFHVLFICDRNLQNISTKKIEFPTISRQIPCLCYVSRTTEKDLLQFYS